MSELKYPNCNDFEKHLLTTCFDVSEFLYHIETLASCSESFSSFTKNHYYFLVECFKKFNNFIIFVPDYFKKDETFCNIAVKHSASNILSFDRYLSFEELKKYVKINPFVSIYSSNFLNEKQQDLLFFEAFKNKPIQTFYNHIKNEEIKENILIDIFLGKIKTENEELMKESVSFIKNFSKEELELIKELKK